MQNDNISYLEGFLIIVSGSRNPEQRADRGSTLALSRNIIERVVHVAT